MPRMLFLEINRDFSMIMMKVFLYHETYFKGFKLKFNVNIHSGILRNDEF